MSLLNSTIVTWMVTNVVGQVIAGFIVLAISIILTYYLKERRREAREDKKEEKTKKLKEIDNELNIVYFPMLDVIANFLKKRGWTRNTPTTINDTSELENAIEDLIRKVKLKGYKIDGRVMNRKTKFFGHNSNTVYNLSVFLEDIELKINELQDEKRKYI